MSEIRMASFIARRPWIQSCRRVKIERTCGLAEVAAVLDLGVAKISPTIILGYRSSGGAPTYQVTGSLRYIGSVDKAGWVAGMRVIQGPRARAGGWY